MFKTKVLASAIAIAALASAAAATPALAATSASAPVSAAACAPVYAYTVGGTYSTPGDGSLPEATISSLQSPSIHAYPVDYPASTDYDTSKAIGEAHLHRLLQDRSRSGQHSKIVLVGYSQGAWVISDLLAAGHMPDGKQIAAIVMFGEPTFVAGEPYDVDYYQPGVNGTVYRAPDAFDKFSTRLQSYLLRERQCLSVHTERQRTWPPGLRDRHFACGQLHQIKAGRLRLNRLDRPAALPKRGAAGLFFRSPRSRLPNLILTLL